MVCLCSLLGMGGATLEQITRWRDLFGALSGFVFDFVFGFVFAIGLEALAKEFLFLSVLDTIVKTLMGRTPGFKDIFVFVVVMGVKASLRWMVRTLSI